MKVIKEPATTVAKNEWNWREMDGESFKMESKSFTEPNSTIMDEGWAPSRFSS